MLAGALCAASCNSTRQPYSLDVPAVILAPAAQAGLVDRRARFREIFCAVAADVGTADPYNRPCNNALHRLSDEPLPSGQSVVLGPGREKLRIFVVPGIFGECAEGMAKPFEDAITHMRARGWIIEPLPISGRSSSAENARAIAEELRKRPLAAGERLVLIGYSKGMSDVIELLATDTSAIIPDGSAIVSVTGVVAGTPLADGNEQLYRRVWWVPLPGCRPGDGGGVSSLTRRHRLNFLASHPLPGRLRYYSLGAFTDAANISSYLRAPHNSLSKIDPRNDGNVLFHDGLIPGSRLLGFANSDHWALTLPFSLQAPFRSKFFATRNEYPRVVLIESIARMIEEDIARQGRE